MASQNLIYGLCDPRTGFLRYIGKSTSGLRRPKQHAQPHALEKRTHTAVWVRSLLRAGTRPEVVVLEETSRDALFDAEQFFIGYFKSIGCDLTNQTIGGAGPLGWKMPEETKAKIGATKTGRRASDEARANNAAAQIGRKHSLETLEKIRAWHRRPEARAVIGARFRGIPKSAEQRAKIAESNRRTKAFRRAA